MADGHFAYWRLQRRSTQTSLHADWGTLWQVVTQTGYKHGKAVHRQAMAAPLEREASPVLDRWLADVYSHDRSPTRGLT